MIKRLQQYTLACLVGLSAGVALADSGDPCKPGNTEYESTKKSAYEAIDNSYKMTGMVLFAGFPKGENLKTVDTYFRTKSDRKELLAPLPGQKAPRIRIFSLDTTISEYHLGLEQGADTYLTLHDNNSIPTSICSEPIVKARYEDGSYMDAQTVTNILVVYPEGSSRPEIKNSCYGGKVDYVSFNLTDTIKDIEYKIFKTSGSVSPTNLWIVGVNQNAISDFNSHGSACQSLIRERYQYIAGLNPNP